MKRNLLDVPACWRTDPPSINPQSGVEGSQVGWQAARALDQRYRVACILQASPSQPEGRLWSAVLRCALLRRAGAIPGIRESETVKWGGTLRALDSSLATRLLMPLHQRVTICSCLVPFAGFGECANTMRQSVSKYEREVSTSSPFRNRFGHWMTFARSTISTG